MLAGFPACMLPRVASEPDVEWLPILGFMLCWALACLSMAWLLAPALSSAGARLSTLRYAVLDAVAFGLLWLGMGLLLSCAEDGLPVPRILLAVLVALPLSCWPGGSTTASPGGDAMPRGGVVTAADVWW